MLSIIVEVVCRSHNRNNEEIFTGSGSVMGAVLLIIKDLTRVLMSYNCHTSAIVKHECNTSVLVNNGLFHHHRPDGIIPGIHLIRLPFQSSDEQRHLLILLGFEFPDAV